MTNKHIVACTEGFLWFSQPKRVPITLRQAELPRIVGRKIIGWSPSLGDYGGGGPGFFGLKLGAKAPWSREWLVLCLWGAGGWLLFDGKRRWNDFGPVAKGSKIVDVVASNDSILFRIEKGADPHVLELPKDTPTLPEAAKGERRFWNPQENILDAWVISRWAMLSC